MSYLRNTCLFVGGPMSYLRNTCLFVGGPMSYLRNTCLFAYSGAQHILCCVVILFVFILCAVCYRFLWIVRFWLPLRYSITFTYWVVAGRLQDQIVRTYAIYILILLWQCKCPSIDRSQCHMLSTSFVLLLYTAEILLTLNNTSILLVPHWLHQVEIWVQAISLAQPLFIDFDFWFLVF